ncbi:MAG: STAS domain-containing protein [Zetaproteobacteria bacterium]|nr:STAS domain-containing protein [Zetaproteobacteria bacterium]
MTQNDTTSQIILDVANLLSKNHVKIYELWMQQQMLAGSLRLDLMSRSDLEEQSKQFLDSFFNALSDGYTDHIDGDEFQHVNALLLEIYRSRAIQGFSPAETATFIFSLKEVCLNFIQTECKDNINILRISLTYLSQMIDKLGLKSFEIFTLAREAMAREQSDTILSMATPITSIWNQILLLPIIGTIDSQRAQNMMETMLEKILELNSKVIIMDVLGVAAIDSSVAQHLIKISQATELMGCRCIITGISPQIAQAIVNLGLDLGGIMSTATLKDGVEVALKYLNLKIVSIQS